MASAQRIAVARIATKRDVEEAFLRAEEQAKSINAGGMFGAIDPAERAGFALKHLAQLYAQLDHLIQAYAKQMRANAKNDALLGNQRILQGRGCVYSTTIDVDLLPRIVDLFNKMIDTARIIRLTEAWIAQNKSADA